MSNYRRKTPGNNPASMRPAARLICGILARNQDLLQQAENLLTAEFGPIILRSEVIPWNFSRYYEPEMGPNLLRGWVCHQPLVPAEKLPGFKKTAIALEQKMLDPQGNRQVNLDPGILTLFNLVLATTKGYTHRIYLGDGIYAELTLIYHKGSFLPLDWTYPDYRTETCLKFLAACRASLLAARSTA